MTRCIQIGKEIVAIWGDERDGKMTLGKMVVVPASLFKNQLKLKTDNCKLTTVN